MEHSGREQAPLRDDATGAFTEHLLGAPRTSQVSEVVHRARGLVEGMAAVHGTEPEIGSSEGMGPRGMGQHGMMRGRGVGPALLYGPPAEGITVERAIVWEGVHVDADASDLVIGRAGRVATTEA